MKYEMQVWVSVSAANEHDAARIIELKIKQRAGWHGNDVTYIDAEALKAEPECMDCDALLPEGSDDYSLCPACAAIEVK